MMWQKQETGSVHPFSIVGALLLTVRVAHAGYSAIKWS